MPNMENFLVYEDFQYQLVSHVLVLGFGAMLAGLVYFALTSRSVAPKYRLAHYLGCVVMVSAALILYNQYDSWDGAFEFSRSGEAAAWYNPELARTGDAPDLVPPGGAEYELDDSPSEGSQATRDGVFSNGFRYMNWTIDVPMLQIQLLVAIGATGATFCRNAVKFTVAGLLMIYTSYVAQFFEPALSTWVEWEQGVTMFWLFYALGWGAYLYILATVYESVFKKTSHMHPKARDVMRGIWWLFLISWTVYAVAIAMPAISFTSHGVVWRQYLFTAADIVSKVIFGAMIGRVVLYQSAAEGYEPAIAELGWGDHEASAGAHEGDPHGAPA